MTRSSLFSVRLSDGRTERLTHCSQPCSFDTGTAFSRDGNVLSFLRVSYRNRLQKIMRVNLRTRNLKRVWLRPRLQPASTFSFMADGTPTLVAYEPGQKFGIYIRQASSHSFVRADACGDLPRCVVASGVAWGQEFGIVELDVPGGPALARLSASGEFEGVVVPCTHRVCPYAPALSDLGGDDVAEELAFESGAETLDTDIYVSRADGGHRRQLTAGPAIDCCADWAPGAPELGAPKR